MTRLVIIHGPANTGKMAELWSVAASDPDLRLIHRDQIRVLFGRTVDERTLTMTMASMAGTLLSNGYGVVTCGQNESNWDAQVWDGVALSSGATIEWRKGLSG